MGGLGGVMGGLGMGVPPSLGAPLGVPRFPSGGSSVGGGSASPFPGGFVGAVGNEEDPSLAGRSLFVGNVSDFLFFAVCEWLLIHGCSFFWCGLVAVPYAVARSQGFVSDVWRYDFESGCCDA